MRSGITITGQIKLIEEEAEGLECYQCRETAWLKQHRLVVVFDGGGMMKTNMVFCDSCQDGLLSSLV